MSRIWIQSIIDRVSVLFRTDLAGKPPLQLQWNSEAQRAQWRRFETIAVGASKLANLREAQEIRNCGRQERRQFRGSNEPFNAECSQSFRSRLENSPSVSLPAAMWGSVQNASQLERSLRFEESVLMTRALPS
jgi:hypothetical protein